MLLTVLLFFAGLLFLYGGAEVLVRGSANLAFSFGIRPLVVGMTIVAFATSMPEMMVSLSAAIKGSADMAAGNVIGSNVANIGLILGTAACLTVLPVGRGVLFREVPFMLMVSGLVCLFVIDGLLSFSDGVILFLTLLAFVGYCVYTSRSPGVGAGSAAQLRVDRPRELLLVVLGIVGLALGAEMMVRSAVVMARAFGISELVIGMTVVAVGTSLPELAASIVSAAKGQIDISVGNVIGSNIFNLGFVLGVCPMIRPLPVDPTLLHLELPAMMLFSLMIFPLVGRSGTLTRGKGVILLLLYVVFIGVMTWRS